MQAMSTSVNLHGADGDECGQHGAGCGDFFCACAMCLEFVAMNALCRIFEASFAMSWTAGNSLWSNFNVAFLHSLFVFFLHQ